MASHPGTLSVGLPLLIGEWGHGVGVSSAGGDGARGGGWGLGWRQRSVGGVTE